MANACATLFFDCSPDDIIAQYEANVTPANGYLTRLNGHCILVDAAATETADWARQIELAAAFTDEDSTALSIFMVGDLWAMAVSRDGKTGPVAAFTPDDPKALEQLPHRLLVLERLLDDFFPDYIDIERVDELFGALLEGAIASDEAFTDLLEMLDFPADWARWSWYETIPEQLFMDPDLADRVTPLGEARELWEE